MRILSIFFLFLASYSFSQQLMINEVSQGTQSKEYVEFVVIGSPICEGQTIPCIDLRKVIIDDNNGFFAPGSGTGVAAGALRFSNDVFWSCIPQGTFIVVYNESDINGSIPADDISVTDGNCTIIIPGNSPLLESTQTSPNSNDPLYPAEPAWGPSQGWAVVSMNNNNDSFQIPNLGVNGTPLHSVSWGNNTSGSIIFFTGPVSNKVISFQNTISNDFLDQNNWIIDDVATGQTPGAANSLQNDLWIGTMNPTCRVNPALSFAITNADCGASNGSITLTVANANNVSILWENNATTPTISNLSPDTYTVVVTDNLTTCTFTDSAVVGLNNSTLASTPAIVDESCTGLCDGTVNLNITGGQTPYTQIWSQNGTGIPAPTNFCNGTYDVTIRDANNCEIDKTIQVNTLASLSYTVSNDTTICTGDTLSITVNTTSSVLWSNAGETTNSIQISPNQSTTYNVIITENTCVVTESITVAVNNCEFDIEFPNVFTPNGDLQNDFYVPVSFAGVKNKNFTIVNRWGNIVFETTEQLIKWDGKVEGKAASEGVYFYICNYEDVLGKAEVKHGFFHLISK